MLKKEIILKPIQEKENALTYLSKKNIFLYELSYELLKNLNIDTTKWISQENKFFIIHKTFPEKILEDLIYLKEYQKNISEKEEKLGKFIQEFKEMKNIISNQNMVMQTIENAYIEKINDLNQKLDYSYKSIQKLIDEKNENQEKYEIEKKELMKIIENEKKNFQKLNQKFDSMCIENESLNNENNLLKDEIEKYQINNKKIELKNNFNKIFFTSNVKIILNCLTTKECLNLRTISKSLYIYLGVQPAYFNIVCNNLKLKYEKDIMKLINLLDFNKKLYQEIPEDYLKTSLIKFLGTNYKIDENISKILKKSHAFLESDIVKYKSEITFEKETLDENFFENFSEESKNSTNDLAFDELKDKDISILAELKERPSDKKITDSIQTETKKSTNFFKRFFTNSNSDSKKKKEKINLNILNQIISKINGSNELNIDNESLKTYEKENKNINNIETKKVNIEYKLNRKLIEYSNEENPEKIELFLRELMILVSEFIIYSSYLMQETKELESVKLYLLRSNDKINIDLFNLKDKFEDLQIESQSDKKLKEYFGNKSKEIEKKVHISDSIIFKNNELIQGLNNQISLKDEQINNLSKEKKNLIEKMKTLSSEVKNLRIKITDLESNYKSLVNDCLEMKIVFEKFPLEFN